MSVTPLPGHGVEVKIRIGSVYTLVSDVSDVDIPSIENVIHEFSTHDGPATRRAYSGLANLPPWTFSVGAWNPGSDAGQGAVEDAWLGATVADIQITVGGEDYAMDGLINVKLTSVSTEVQKATVTVSPDGGYKA